MNMSVMNAKRIVNSFIWNAKSNKARWNIYKAKKTHRPNTIITRKLCSYSNSSNHFNSQTSPPPPNNNQFWKLVFIATSVGTMNLVLDIKNKNKK